MRTTSETLGTLLGLVLLGARFFWRSPIGKIRDPQGTEGAMKKMMQAPANLVQIPDGAITPLRWAAIVVELVPAYAAVGWHVGFASLLLMLFLIAATCIFHPFWRYQGEEMQNLMIEMPEKPGDLRRAVNDLRARGGNVQSRLSPGRATGNRCLKRDARALGKPERLKLVIQ